MTRRSRSGACGSAGSLANAHGSAHKGLAVETIPWRFTDKAAVAFSGQERVPVIRDGDRVVSDSWAIAEYLETTYPDRPSLFGGATGLAHARFVNAWTDSVMMGGIARLILRDLQDVVAPQDRAYFRQSREARFGMTLEAVQSGRETRVTEFRASLLPVRLVLGKQTWLGGEAPSYADYIVFGSLQWPRCVSRSSCSSAMIRSRFGGSACWTCSTGWRDRRPVLPDRS